MALYLPLKWKFARFRHVRLKSLQGQGVHMKEKERRKLTIAIVEKESRYLILPVLALGWAWYFKGLITALAEGTKMFQSAL